MEYLEVIVGMFALIIAIRALNLQRREIIKNGKISALIHSASMIQSKIDYHSRIITDMKNQGKPYEDWQGHEKRINTELRPLKEEIDTEFLNVISSYDGLLHEDKIRHAIKARKR